MKLFKPFLYSALAGLVLTSCKSVKNYAAIPVPVAIDNSVNISAKKAELTDFEKDNWQHLDLATDSIPGMSVDKAYKFLQGKSI